MKQKKKQKRLEKKKSAYLKLMEENPRWDGAFTMPGSYKKC